MCRFHMCVYFVVCIMYIKVLCLSWWQRKYITSDKMLDFLRVMRESVNTVMQDFRVGS